MQILYRPLNVFFLVFVGFNTLFSTCLAEDKTGEDKTVDVKPIHFGILPYLSPEKLISRYAPMVHYVGEKMHQTSLPESAPNFMTYIDRMAHYKFDLCVTAPHFAALAESKFGYKRLARLTRELDGAIVVNKQSLITSIEQLKGKTLATPDKLAIITILGELDLEKHGIQPEKDITIKNTPSHNTALLEVIGKRANAAVVSSAVYESMDPNLKKQLRLIGTTQRVPHMMLLASPKMSEDRYNLLKKTVLDYKANGAGKKFFEESGYIDIQPITDKDMNKMREMLPLLESRLP